MKEDFFCYIAPISSLDGILRIEANEPCEPRIDVMRYLNRELCIIPRREIYTVQDLSKNC